MRAKCKLAALVCLALGAGVPGVRADSNLQSRRVQIEQMNPAEQQELLKKQERFASLPLADQERLRKLQADLDADPKAEQLHQVLSRYHEWLKTLSPTERAELGELAPEERIKRIKSLQQKQEMARRAELLSSKDVKTIGRWTEDLLWAHREDLIKNMPEQQRKGFLKWDEQRQRQSLPFFVGGRRGSNATDLIQPADIEELADKLSPAAKQELTKSTDIAAQRSIVRGWIFASMRHSYPGQGPRRPSTFTEDGMTQFFLKDLKQADKDRLLKLPPDQMRAELRKLYFEDRERGWGGYDRGGPDGRHRDPGGPDRFKGRGPRPPHEPPQDRAAGDKPTETKATEKPE